MFMRFFLDSKIFLKFSQPVVVILLFSSIIIYNLPFGLMDDYTWFFRTEKIISSPVLASKGLVEAIIKNGMFQPFLPIQHVLQYSWPLFFPQSSIYFINFGLVFLSVYFFIKSLSSIKKVDLKISFLVFLIWPYSFDLFIHPSLQEKYIFLFFPLLIYFLYKRQNKTFVFFLSFLLPLIKLQGSIFILIICFNYLKNKHTIELWSILGFIFGISIQAYLIFFSAGNYYSTSLSFKSIILNLTIPQHFVFFISIVFYLLFKKLNKTIVFLDYGIALSSLALLFIFLNWSVQGYLLSIYGYFFAYLFSSIYLDIFPILRKFIDYFLIILTIFSLIFFYIPRAERWHDINYLQSNLNQIDTELVYYSCLEGSEALNNFFLIDPEIKYSNNFDSYRNNQFYFISDTWSCSGIENTIIQNCNQEDKISMSRFQRINIIKYDC